MAMIKCRECGADISSEAKACPHCGKPMAIRTYSASVAQCVSCGREISNDAWKCAYCGKIQPKRAKKINWGKLLFWLVVIAIIYLFLSGTLVFTFKAVVY